MITRKSHKIIAMAIGTLLVLGVIGVIIFTVLIKLPRGAVVTNGKECAKIGLSILDKGGNAVDAAIAALFCEGVSMPQSMGLGGGFLMTIYIREEKKAVTLNARETAPAAAKEDMFHGDIELSSRGGLSAAIPGELRGYWQAYNKYGGKVPWKDLVQPTINLCKNGIFVTEYLAGIWAQKLDLLYHDPYLRESFIDPKTNLTIAAGQYMKRLRLAKALEIIAEEGGDAVHNGSLTENFAEDIQAAGGIITASDLRNYKPEWQEPIKVDLPFDEVLYTSPLPGAGVILSFILNILKDFLDFSQPNNVTNWQRIVESFKYGYGKRTELGDMNFVDIKQLVTDLTSPEYANYIKTQIRDNMTYQDPEHYGANTSLVEDHGTAHISVLAPNGDAVSVTSTINLYFGAGFMSPSTGIILNDEMDDFSSPNITNSFDIPPSISNYIVPGKRPVSSMCPSIVVGKDGDVRLVVGSAGGSKITTSVALVILRNLWYGASINDSIQANRLHHQLFPMYIEFEDTFIEEKGIIEKLHQIGHEYKLAAPNGFSAVTAISKQGNKVEAASDKRRPGRALLLS